MMAYLEFLCSCKGTQIYDLCIGFCQDIQNGQSLQTYFMNFKRMYEELNILLLFSLNIRVWQAQCEKIALMSFLVGLDFLVWDWKSQVLSNVVISPLHEVFTRLLGLDTRTSITPNFSDLVSSKSTSILRWPPPNNKT